MGATRLKPNPSETNSDDIFNGMVGNLKDVDEAGNQIIQDDASKTADMLSNAEQHANSTGDPEIASHSNYNSDTARDDLDDKENNPDTPEEFDNKTSGKPAPAAKKRRFRALARKYGPSGGAIGAIVAGFGISSLIAAPATLLVNLSKLFFNHNDIGNHLFIRTGNSYIASLLKGQGRDCTESKIKCKFKTVSDKQLKSYEDRGFKVTSDKTVFGRNKIRALTTPKGTEVKTIREYKALRFSEPTSYSLLKRFPVRAYLAKFSPFEKVLTKFGLKKSNTVKPDKSPDPDERRTKTNGKMDEHTHATTGADEGTRAAARKAKADQDEKFKNRGRIAAKVTKVARGAASPLGYGLAGVLAACASYNVIRATIASVQVLWHKDLLEFAFPFAQAGGQIQAQGSIDNELVENLGDRLMRSDTATTAESPDMIGKNAMDAPAMGAALGGDFNKLKGYEKEYSGWAPTAAVLGSGIMDTVTSAIPGGKDTIRYTCKLAAIAAFVSLVACIGPQVIGCAGLAIAGVVASTIAANFAADYVADKAAEPAMEAIAKANLNSSLFGLRLGQSLGSAFGIMAAEKDRRSGFAIAGTESQAMAFNDAIKDEYNEEKIADARFEASKNQFNPYNQYSFAGRVASIFSPYTSTDGTIFSGMANMVTASLSPIGSLGYVAKATKDGLFQPIQIYSRPGALAGTLKVCEDRYKAEIGIPCMGESGKTSTYMSPMILKCLDEEEKGNRDCFAEAVDYLQGKGYLESDGSGKPVDWAQFKPDDPTVNYDNELLMYMENCTFRVYDIGYTSKSYDDDNIDWFLGSRCGGNDDNGKHIDGDGYPPESPGPEDTKIAWMSYYINECLAVYAGEEDEEYCWSEPAAASTPAAGSAQPVSGAWGCPVDATNGHVTQGPHDIGNGTASGVDYGYAGGSGEGAPIYAVRAGEVIDTGPAAGYGNWIRIKHEENGKQVISYYGHLRPSDILVTNGQHVEAGAHIANVGAGIVGSSSGPHLHAGLEMSPASTAADYDRIMSPCHGPREF